MISDLYTNQTFLVIAKINKDYIIISLLNAKVCELAFSKRVAGDKFMKFEYCSKQ